MKRINNLGFVDLNAEELDTTVGGGFAYDAGFFLRELAIGLVRGPYFAGAAIGIDLGTNYRPVR
jgi:hypothetical protein